MDFNQVLELIKTVSDSQLTAFQYEEGNQKILMHTGSVAWNGAVIKDEAEAGEAKAAIPAGGSTEEKEETGHLITSPLVGRFYTAPSEDAEVYVKVGDTVKKGQTLAIVEAMKLMNEIESDFDGVVSEILANNGEGVEYGQPLFRIA